MRVLIMAHVVFQGLVLALEDKINANYLKSIVIPSGSRMVCVMILFFVKSISYHGRDEKDPRTQHEP